MDIPHVPHVPRIIRSGDLLVANANKDATKLLVYGGCNATSPRRAYRAVVAELSATLVHPYGLALHGTGDVFVSNQDTYNVLRYTNTSGLGPWAAAWVAHSDYRLALALALAAWHRASRRYALLTTYCLPGLDRIRPV